MTTVVMYGTPNKRLTVSFREDPSGAETAAAKARAARTPPIDITAVRLNIF